MLRENQEALGRQPLGLRKSGREANSQILDTKRSARRQQEIIAATERAEDLLTLWREQRRLAHRVRLARLCFEFVDCTRADEFAEIAAEVADWRSLVRAFAETRMAA